MDAKYTKSLAIPLSRCDSTGRLSIPGCFEIFMDIAAEHAELLGLGASAMLKSHRFWLTAKTMIRFLRRPYLGEKLEISTWPEVPDRFRCNRDYALTQNGQPLALGKTEWGIINTDTRRLESAEGIYPENLPICPDLACPEPFTRVEGPFDGEPFARHQVVSTDIDLGGHMNNAAYIRAIASAFSAKEWNGLRIVKMEAVYLASCYEGDELELRRADKPDGLEIAVSLPGGKQALLARLYTTPPSPSGQ